MAMRLKKPILLLLAALFTSACFSTKITGPALTGLAGSWSYSNTQGEATVTENGFSLIILMSYKPIPTPGPHYKLSLVRFRNILTGTWICLIEGLRGCGKTNKVKLKIEPSGRSIIVLESEDPEQHGITPGLILHKKE